MANEEVFKLLKQGVDAWNKWRREKIFDKLPDPDSADVTGAELDAYLARARLSHADLSDAYLAEANLTEADLKYVDLRGANLSHANLEGADLTWAHLDGAYLTRVALTEADLTGATLVETYLGKRKFKRVPNLRDFRLGFKRCTKISA